MNYLVFILSIVLWVCQSGQGFGQSQADRYFEYEQFYKAAKLYQEALQADSTHLYAAYQLAECYRRLFTYQTAEKYYKKVYEADSSATYPLALFYYALMLKFNEHFREAITHFDEYLAYPEKLKRDKIENYTRYDAQAAVEKNGCYFALTQLSRRSKNYNFDKLPPPLNTEYNDYAPAIYRHDTLVAITSGRLTSGNPIDNRFGESFGDIFQFEKTEQGWKIIEKDEGFGIINTKWADGSGTFNHEKTKYYYTSCGNKNETCRIYVTEYKNQKWQEPVLLNKNINAPQSNAKQPALTAGSDTLFFVSDREGGFGGNDIWMSISAGGDNWSPAVNLGENINTASNELSPFYYPQIPALFFSSNGHEGFGGLDIYRVEGNVKKGKIINLGWPFNSSRDDLYFVFGNNAGYLSSNRDDTETKFDIYSFAKHAHQDLVDYIDEGTHDKDPLLMAAQDKNTNHPGFDGLIEGNISGVKTSVSDLTLSYAISHKNLRSGANRFILSATVGDVQVINVASNDNRVIEEYDGPISRTELLFGEENNIVSQTPPGVLAIINTFSLTDTAEQAMVTGELYDAHSNTPIAEEIVQLANDQGDVIKITTTDKKGSFKFSNLNARERYRIVLKESASDQYPEYYLTDVKVVSYGGDISIVKFENIYFDNNDYQLRNEAKLVLEELIDFYRANPELQIEINAYTDSTGGDVYNIELSRKRGKEAFDYLISQGIERTAVVINAKGKEAPVAANDNPAGKQLNRRVEFEIIGPDIQYQPATTTLVVKTGMSLSALVDNTGVKQEELQLLNNFNTTYIPAYTPVRVKRPVNHIDETLFAGTDTDKKVLGQE
jgi:outer membrane protein OmpA-like peptidoglycan-associated protein/tetratricopeptide (TPR) repeat protein